MRASHHISMALVGEGFILKVHPEGQGVRLITNQE